MNNYMYKRRQSMVNLNDTALTLARHVITTTKSRDANLVLSPVSIHVVLGLIAAGSKGPSREQVLGFLKSKSIDKVNSLASELVSNIFSDGGGGPRLAFANGLWVDQSLMLKPEFEDIARTHYKADSSRVDFQNEAPEVKAMVNAWVENVTNGLIKDLLPDGSVYPSTRLILANALYFKGAWDEKLDPSQTKEHEFFLLDNTISSVHFMTSQKRQYISAYDGFKVLRLPYKKGDDVRDKRTFSMCIFLPNARNGLPDLIEKMGSEPGFIDRHIPYQQVKVHDFLIPRFKIDFGFEASKVLRGLGLELGDALTEMADSDLYVSSIFHKACIEVNEEGTEAAAATICFLVGASSYHAEEKLIDFVADHPFLFVVREDVSGLILFIGQVVDPLLT